MLKIPIKFRSILKFSLTSNYRIFIFLSTSFFIFRLFIFCHICLHTYRVHNPSVHLCAPSFSFFLSLSNIKFCYERSMERIMMSPGKKVEIYLGKVRVDVDSPWNFRRIDRLGLANCGSEFLLIPKYSTVVPWYTRKIDSCRFHCWLRMHSM